MECSLDADSPINTPVLPCTPDFYHSHSQQVNCFSLTGQQQRSSVTSNLKPLDEEMLKPMCFKDVYNCERMPQTFFGLLRLIISLLAPLSHDQSYRMDSSPRGFALVISNVSFDSRAAPDLDPRKGGEVDDEVLRKVLTELDYLVSVHRNLTAQVRPPWSLLEYVVTGFILFM